MATLKLSSKDLIPCLLCFDAPCSKACPHKKDPAKLLRSLRFVNYGGAISRIDEACVNCDGECESGCLLDEPPKIKRILSACADAKEKMQLSLQKADISAEMCGIKLENPFLLSSSVVASTYEMIKRAFEAGWAGAAYKTISYIDIHEASPRFSALKNIDGSFLAFRNIEQLSDHSPSENFAIIRKLKDEFPTKVILASIMGRNDEEWRELAILAEESGADAVELNFSCPNMTEEDTGSDVGQIPHLVERFTRVVKEAVHIPVLAKLTPNVLAMSPAAEAAKRGGADGLAAINTIKSITDLNILHALNRDIADAKVTVGGLSGQSVKPIALRFIAELSRNPKLKGMHISAMGGVYNREDVMAYVSLGAGSIQVTTAVMEYGYRIIEDLTEGLAYFLSYHGFSSLSDFKGTMLNKVVDVAQIERDRVIYPRFDRTRCVGCGRCYISCMDGGHQAIDFKNRQPLLNPKKCVGCHLCVLVCPNDAIQSSEVSVVKK